MRRIVSKLMHRMHRIALWWELESSTFVFMLVLAWTALRYPGMFWDTVRSMRKRKR